MVITKFKRHFIFHSRYRIFIGILFLIILNFCGGSKNGDFPVTPVLFVEGTFEGAEGVAFNGEGKLFVAADKAFWHLDSKGKTTKLADLYSNLGVTAIGERDLLIADFGPTNRFSDGPNSDGIIWRITPEGEKSIAATGGMGDPNFIALRDDGSYLVSDDATDEIFLVNQDGEVRLFTDIIGHPNGMLISPDGRTLYVAQIFKSIRPLIWDNRVWAIPLDEKGNPSGEPNIIAVMDGEFAGPDGLTMDILGRLYVTLPRKGEIWRVDPENGNKILIAKGMPGIANIVFGRGEFDHQMLYGVSTRRGGGKIWKINVGVTGVHLRHEVE